MAQGPRIYNSSIAVLGYLCLFLLNSGDAFSTVSNNQLKNTVSISFERSFHTNPHHQSFIRTSTTALNAQKKKRRRRKQPPPTTVDDKTTSETNVLKMDPPVEAFTETSSEGSSQGSSEGTVDAMAAEPPTPASPFKFDKEEVIAMGVTDAEEGEEIIPAFAPPKGKAGAVKLPSFSEAIQKKKQKGSNDEDDDNDDESETEPRNKIDRADISSFTRLLEVEPNADTDMSFFNQEEYGTVSALLSEGAKPFLGIPSGPLQVGHFIGAGGIFLMAFVEYPGFPLTNLPSPLRGALQGGLGAVYLINLVLAVFSTFKAGERGQPVGLWGAKTFAVGGLAYDQLTQLPTTKEVEERMAKKGKRAIKNMKK